MIPNRWAAKSNDGTTRPASATVAAAPGPQNDPVPKAVILDVGGTLWPDRWPATPRDGAERARALRTFEPSLSAEQAGAIVEYLADWNHPATGEQRTVPVVREAIARLLPGSALAPGHVTRAMCLPAKGRVPPFPGAVELLGSLAERGVRVVLASNVAWRSGEDQYRDLEDLGVRAFVSACITSLDVGWRKPDPRFFTAVLDAAGWPPAQCVMVGDSETNDIVPALQLGMTTIKVAIEADPELPTCADHVCRSLGQVATVILDLPEG